MNRIGILLLTAVVSAGVFAQTPGMQPGRAAARLGRMQQLRDNRLLANYLGLTADQIAKQKAINQTANEQAKAIRQELNQANKDLREAIRSLQPVDAIASQIGTLTGQLTLIRAKARQDFLKILTPDQLQKLQSLNTPPPAPAKAPVQQ
jgi:Spy/CpxP family protein refolding chaperone